jgi:thioredoxin:protein disulfide reductase
MTQLLKQSLLTCCFILITLGGYAHASIFDISSPALLTNNATEFAPVDEAFQFDFSQQQRQVRLTFQIKDGYYLYRHQFKIKSKNAIIKPVELPQGLPHEDEFFGSQQIFNTQLSFIVELDTVDKNAELSIRYQGCAEKGLCYPPQIKIIPLDRLNVAHNNSLIAPSVLSALSGVAQATAEPEPTQISIQNSLAQQLQQNNLWLTLIAFFIGGLLLAFTPCVFPMYPILTGIIVGQGQQLSSQKAFRLSFVYVQGMAITYTALGIVVALAGAQFQAMFQHPVVLISLSLLFMLLALSMFGGFNLALPASWQHQLTQLSNRQQGGSYWGVLIMGVLSGLVASPCTTAPLTGALLYISQTGDVLLGAIALYALSLGMGLPLLILGSSGAKLLPKAGAWMAVIKHSFGLLLLAVPIFLLQRILPEPVTELLWLSLLLASASYFYVLNQNSTQPKGFWFGLRALLIFLVLFWSSVQVFNLVTPTQQHDKLSPMTTNIGHQFIKIRDLAELRQQVQQASYG